MKRPSDTAAIASMPVADHDGPQHLNVSVRKIDNGYVSTHSHERGGEYVSSEEYHKVRPDLIELAGGKLADKGVQVPVNHLKGAVSLLNRKGV